MKFISGQKYFFKVDFNDDCPSVGVGLIKKGTVVIFESPNLGLARFIFEDGRRISLFPKVAFKILGEIKMMTHIIKWNTTIKELSELIEQLKETPIVSLPISNGVELIILVNKN